MADAIAVLKQQGAIVVDPADVPSLVDKDPQQNFARWDFCSGANQAKGKDANCSVNFKYGMKRDFNAWLKSLGPSAPVKTLTELREWNMAHEKAGAIKYGQSRSTSRTKWISRRDRARNEADRDERHSAQPRERHRRGVEGESARRDPVSRAAPARDRRPRRLPDHRRAVRHDSERAERRRSRPGSTRSRRRSASASPARPAASRD